MPSAKSKTITKNSIALYIRMFVLMLIGLYTSRIVLDILGVNDFGIYNLVAGIVIMANFITNALTLSTNRFLAFYMGEKDGDLLKATFIMSVNIHLLFIATIILVAEVVGVWFINSELDIPNDRMAAANIVYQASIVAFAIQMVGSPFNSDIITHERMDVYAVISILFGIAKLAIAFLLPLIPCDRLMMYGLLMVIPALIYTLSNIIYANHHFNEATFYHYWSDELFKKMIKFTGYSTFGNFATAAVGLGQNVLLNIFYGPYLNAARGLSVQANNAITGLINGIYTAVNPQIIKSYAQKDFEYFEKLIYYSTLAGFYFLLIISIPLFFETDYLLALWLKEVPPYTTIFIKLLVVNSLVYNLVTPSWMALQSTENIARIHLTTGTINLLNIVITYLLWKFVKIEPYSIFIINIILSTFIQIATLIIQKQQLGFRISSYLKCIIVPITVVVVLSSPVPLLIIHYMEESFLRLLLLTASSTVWCLLMIYLFGIKKDLRDLVNDSICTVISKVRSQL